MAEIEHVSELLSFATTVMHCYYTVLVLAQLLFFSKENFASFVTVK